MSFKEKNGELCEYCRATDFVGPTPAPGEGVLPEKLGGGVLLASQNPYPIND